MFVIPQPESGDIKRLGKHWEDTWELFFIISDSIANLVLEDIHTKERRTYPNLGPGTRIILPPKAAHLLEVDEETMLLAMTEAPYTPEIWIPYDFFPNLRTEAL